MFRSRLEISSYNRDADTPSLTLTFDFTRGPPAASRFHGLRLYDITKNLETTNDQLLRHAEETILPDATRLTDLRSPKRIRDIAG